MRDWLLGLDPGLQRLRGALRALLAMLLSIAALRGVGRVIEIPIAATMLAAVAAMIGSRASDADRRGRLITIALLPLSLILAASAVALTADDPPWLADGLLVVIVYVAVEARRLGPRGMLLGMAGVIGFFLARYIGVDRSQLGMAAAGPVVGAAVTMIVREWIVGDPPRAKLRWCVRAFRAQGRHVARLLLAQGRSIAATPLRIEAALGQLNACALAASNALEASGVTPKRRTRLGAALTDAELVVEHSAATLQQGSETGRQGARAALAAVLGRHHRDAARITGTFEPRDAPQAPRHQRLIREPVQKNTGETSQRAIQAAIASATAIAAGTWLSPTRWYWALLAAFVVFAGTSSTGETLKKVWARVLGTVFGVAAGMVLVRFVGTNEWVNGSLIATLAFLGLYLQPVSYLAMTLCITVILGLVYALIGQSTDNLLTLRLEETAIGAFFGGVAALTLFPVHTRDAIALAMSAYLEALDDTVASSIDALTGGAPETPPHRCSRELDKRLRDLVVRSQPVLNPLPGLSAPPDQRDTIVALASCSYFARHLARVSETAGPSSGDNAGYRRIQERIRAASRVVSANADSLPVAAYERLAGPGVHDLAQIARVVEGLAQKSERALEP